MKIIIAIDHFREGGAERVASVIANKLCREHEVHALVMEEGINYPLDLERIHYHLVEYNRGNRLIRKWSKLKKFRKIMRSIDADVVFSFANIVVIYTVWSLLGQKHKHIRVIGSERTDPTKEPENPITRWLRDKAYNACDYLVCQTSWVQNYFKNKIKSKCVVISNPISPNLPIWQGENSKRIMTACRLTEQKNLPLLLNAFKLLSKEHPEMKLVIYGDGRLRDGLQRQIDIERLADIVEMPGFSCNILSEMIDSYMYVSSSDYEGISNSMLEALGCGLPTVCTDCPVGGAGMFIKDGENGLLVPVGDEQALYKAMKRMVEDSGFAKKCSANSRYINEELKVERIVNQWIDLISK